MIFRTMRAKGVAVATATGIAAVLTVGLSAASGAAVSGDPSGAGQGVQLDRAFVIVLENHSQQERHW